MPFTYRSPGPWGAGTGANLTVSQFDGNTYEAQQRIEALEAAIDAFGGVIESVTLSGTTLTFHLVGGAEHSVTLPVPRPNRVEAWQPNTFYVPWDFVSHNGSVYIVLFAHTSAATFDPGANNGEGQDYYGLFFNEPALMIPEGGLTGQVLTKASNDDFATIWQFPAIMELRDVEISDPAEGDSLIFDGEKWINDQPKPGAAAVQTIDAAEWTPGIADASTYNRFIRSAGTLVRVPSNATVAFPIGTEIHGRQASAGAVEIAAASGVVVNPQNDSLNITAGAGATFTLKKVGLNEWDLMGRLASSSP
jgi:hypothetical protein